MKRVLLSMLLLLVGLSANAQQKIQLRSTDRAECIKSDMTSLKASFSFSTIEAEDYQSERGTFSWLSLSNTVLSGIVGEPQIPVVNELIAVPFGAQPRIEITSFSSTDYNLAEYDMKTLVPRQRPVRKSDYSEEAPFILNEAAYQVRGLRSEPQASVNVEGIMRGIQIGTMTIEPVSYDPVNNTIRVFNDIEVTVHFDGADAQATEDMLLKTYSPAFDAVYAQLFNNRAITDVYTDHPDMYNSPVKVLVICYSGFKNNSALNSWLQWKLQKGYYVDIYYTNETGTTASAIASFIKTKYNASVSAGNAYTYLIVIGDTGQVPQYMTKTIDNTIGECASDLGYAAVNFTTSNTSNYFPDMYYSRISVENTTHLTNYINKVLTYEKYEFADGGNYLNNVILVGGWDSNWTARVAKPTINYATNNYFNSNNTTYGGFGNGTIRATISTSSTQGWSGTNHGCYNGLNDGVCLLNYTAHGDKQEWQGPQFTAKQAEGVTNTGKYFFGIGNCCLTGNYNLNNANYSPNYAPSSSIGATASFGETMIRVPNAGAIAYVGCSPYSYWYEDFYWAVGAHSYSAGNAPSVSSSSTGVYDIMFNDQYWNSASALMYLGNLAVQQAVTNGNTTSGITSGDCLNSAHYYFQFYHTFGDGSIMPYITKPETNTVTIPSTVTPGTSSITVNALAGSYVAVTDNSSVIYGVAEANSSGMATVNFTNAIPSSGTLHVVVTRQQYQPYFGTINVVGGTQYNITVNQPQYGTISAPSQAYAGAVVTLTANPETGYCLSSWNVRDANNNSITVTNNQFTMPSSNVTVTATFVQGMAVTLASVTNGSISANPLYALQGTTINLTATPDEGYVLGDWMVYKTGDPSTTVTVTGDSFNMPNYPVTVSANFVLGPTDLTVYDGIATNQYIPMYGYYFDDYTKSEFIIPASQLTEMVGGSISAITFYPSSVDSRNWGNSEQTVFLKEVSGTTLGGSYSGMSGATTVKVASPLEMPVANTPYTITFDTPYTYNGGNLLIGIYNTDDGDYNKVEWYGTNNQTSGVSAYGYNDNSLNSVTYNPLSFLPKTTFTYLPTNSYRITATAEPSEGGTVTVGSSRGNRDDLFYDFEDGTYQGWTTFQGNTTSPHSWMHITEYSYAYNYSSMSSGHGYNSSDGYMYSESYITGSSGGNGTIVTPDNYLVSPQVRLGGSITFHAGAQNVSYCAEHFSLMVSTTGNNAANNFTAVQTWTFTPTVSSGSEWQEFTVDLSAYNGMGYIAIRHFDCSDEWFLCIDDITIVEGPDSSTASGNFLSGETCVVTATPVGDYHFVNWTENDILVSTDASFSFTVDSDRNLVANFSTTLSYTLDITGYGTGNGNWYLIASPLNGNTVASEVTNLTYNKFDLYRFNQSNEQEWENYKKEGDQYHFDLEQCKGYLYANSANVTLTFTGVPYSGNGEVIVTNDGEDHPFSGWNLIGNPWSVNATIGNKDFYRMNTDHDEIIISEDSEIAPMEGIFVHTYEDEETVTFSTSGAKANFANERIVLNLSYDDATVIDRAIVRFGEGSTLPKFQIKDNSTKLYFTQDGRDYAVIRTDGQGEIPVHFKASENGEYTLTISASLTSQLSTLTLIDNLTGDNIDILQTPSYSFNARTTDYTSRFRLVFSSDNDDCTPFAFISNDQLFVTGDGTFQIFDALGRQCYGKELSTSNSQLPTSNFHPGVYVLRLVNGESVKIQKIIIK